MREVEILVRGRVQGVNFRNEIKKYALRNSINGFTENLKDGSVKIISQGEENSLKDLVLFVKKSPGISFVEDVKINEGNLNKEYKNFFVKRQKSFFVDKIISLINLFKISKRIYRVPEHVVIIPDGNRRWARRKKLFDFEGHKKAAEFENIFSLFEEAKKMGIMYVSIWGFSTENWSRSEEEKKYLFDIIFKVLKEFERKFNENKIRLRHFGRKDRLPKKIISQIEKLEKQTQKYKDFNVNLCLDYGGRDEILRCVNKAIEQGKKEIDEDCFKNYLDSKGVPDPDLIIRTSGEQRTSGIMPFQSTYSELYFVKKYFPDFNKKDLKKAVLEFSRRKRRYGG